MARDQSTFLYRWRAALLDAELPFAPKAVALMLSMYATSATGADARPGLDRLAAQASLDKRSVRRHLRAAEDAGWIKRTGGGVGGRAVVYALTIPVGGQQRPPQPAQEADRAAPLSAAAGGQQRPPQGGETAPAGGQNKPSRRTAAPPHLEDLETSSTTSTPTTTNDKAMPTPIGHTIDEPPDHDDEQNDDDRATLWRLLAGQLDPADTKLVIDELLNRPDITNARAYLATVIRNDDLERLLDEARRSTTTTTPARRFYSTDPEHLRTCADCGTTIAADFNSPAWFALDGTPCTDGEDRHHPTTRALA